MLQIMYALYIMNSLIHSPWKNVALTLWLNLKLYNACILLSITR